MKWAAILSIRLRHVYEDRLIATRSVTAVRRKQAETADS